MQEWQKICSTAALSHLNLFIDKNEYINVMEQKVEERHSFIKEHCWKSVSAKSITRDNKQICWHFILLSVLLVSAVKPLDVVSLGPQFGHKQRMSFEWVMGGVMT